MSDIKAECYFEDQACSALIDPLVSGTLVYIEAAANCDETPQEITLTAEEFIRWSDAVRAAIAEQEAQK